MRLEMAFGFCLFILPIVAAFQLQFTPKSVLISDINGTQVEYSMIGKQDKPLLNTDQTFECVPKEEDLLQIYAQRTLHNHTQMMVNIPDSDDIIHEHYVPESIVALTAEVIGLRVEKVSKDVSYEDEGVSVILANVPATIRLFGNRFSTHTIIRFVTEQMERGHDCDDASATKYFELSFDNKTNNSALTTVQVPPLDAGETFYFLCVREKNVEMPWVHQGHHEWLMLTTYEKTLPVWLQCCVLVLLLVLSGLFSGLNLGLMALDRTELKIVANTGTDKERHYAKAIQPLRDNGNYLLCSLLLGNVLVNSTLTILLDDLTSGLVAVIISTMAIVIFGEIIPQAVCSRHGLAVGAHTVMITKLFMLLTFPLSFPISIILNKLLGEEIGSVYNREKLMELLRVTNDYNDLEKDELNIISGALELKQKTVADIMTKIDDVYMLPCSAVLDFDTLSDIVNQGFSRIPVYDQDKSDVVSLIYTKDLVFVDPDDKMPLKTLFEFHQTQLNFVFENTKLDVIFKEFKQGNKGHMAFVQKVNDEGDGDPFYETIGIVTLEDVLEELIQAEIEDETDVINEKRKKERRQRRRQRQQGDGDQQEFSFPAFSRDKKDVSTDLSGQMTLATYQYLSTTVEPFKGEHISEAILNRLLQQNVIFSIKLKDREWARSDPSAVIYEQGKAADYFVLILEGRVEVTMGQENLVFESGPFTFFGTQCLVTNMGVGESPSSPSAVIRTGRRASIVPQPQVDSLLHHSSFVPDYSVRAVTDVCYLKIRRSLYHAARQATMLEQSRRYPSEVQEEILEEEINKVMNSVVQDLDCVSIPTKNTLSTTSHGSQVKHKQNGSVNIRESASKDDSTDSVHL